MKSKRIARSLSQLSTEEIIDLMFAIGVTDFLPDSFEGKNRNKTMRDVSDCIVRYAGSKCGCVEFA